MTAGRVGKPHGLDGSFYVDGAEHLLPEGTSIVLRDRPLVVERRAGTDQQAAGAAVRGGRPALRCAAS